jgi:hypothetical protein
MLYNLGQAYYAMGDYPRAYEYYRRFQREASASVREQIPQLDRLLADVRGRIASLHVRVSVAGATVLLRGTRLGETPLPSEVYVAPGEAMLEVTKEGYVPFKWQALLRTGEDVALEVQLSERRADPSRDPSRETTRVASPAIPITERWWFWALVGTGLLGGGVMIYALTETKSPGTGSLPPGRIAGGISF